MKRLSDAAQNLTKIEEKRAEEEMSEFSHIKGIKSKIEAFGGFKPNTSDPNNNNNKKDESQSIKTDNSLTTRKPLTTSTTTSSEVPAKASARPIIVNHREEAVKDQSDSVAVNAPPADASIAEAKPVALSIAGVGGVASSKPVATAVVGPGGLAVARPVATAIAGIDPDEVGGLGVAGFKKTSTKVSGSTSALSNYNLANKLQKENGVSSDDKHDDGDQGDDDDDDETRKEVELNSIKIHPSNQPNLDPFELIPSQFHHAFKIKAPSGLQADVNSRFNSREGDDKEEEKEQGDGVTGWALPPEPNYRLYYSY